MWNALFPKKCVSKRGFLRDSAYKQGGTCWIGKELQTFCKLEAPVGTPSMSRNAFLGENDLHAFGICIGRRERKGQLLPHFRGIGLCKVSIWFLPLFMLDGNPRCAFLSALEHSGNV